MLRAFSEYKLSLAISIATLTFILISCSKKETRVKENLTGKKETNEYVGDNECYACHSKIYDSFKQNGMGKSFYLPNENITGEYEKNNIVYDRKKNLYYKQTHEGNDFYQTEFRKDKNGKVVHELKIKTDYVVGSGNSTKSYIYSQNGFLYQMPLTWYSKEQKWDLSPGYQRINLRFSRPIRQECINCHNSYSEYQPFSNNRYTGNIPLGIGCERCHGPGKNHVIHQTEIANSNKESKTGKDTTIVNSKYLEPTKQLDVCFQCHLQGAISVFKEGRKENDFRPGMRLFEVKGIYVRDETPGNLNIAGHGTNLLMSECFKKSDWNLLCTTCHDPHQKANSITPKEYNSKCIGCHEVPQLTKKFLEKEHSDNGNCISCHMKKSNSNIPHTNTTEHWIRKVIPSRINSQDDLLDSSKTEEAVILKNIFEEDKSDKDVYLGIAYVRYFEERHSNAEYLNRAIVLLQSTSNKEGLYFLGKAYQYQRKLNEAATAFQKLINLEPANANAHFELGNVYEKLNRNKEAIESFTNSVTYFPENYKAYNSLGNLYSKAGNIQKALESYNKSVQVFSNYSISLNNLGELYFVSLNDTSNARKYLELALKYDPDFAMAMLNLGNLELLLGNESAAEILLKKSIELEPSLTAAYGNLALIYKERGDKKEAKKYLNKLLEIDPRDSKAKELLKEL